MTYNVFVDHSIFQSRAVNLACDALVNALIQKFEPEEEVSTYITSNFLLSGTASAILQGENFTSVKNIVFETKEDPIFDWLLANIKGIFPRERVVIFKNRFLIYTRDAYFEIWKCEIMDPKTFSGIQVQCLPHIPEAMLM